MNIEYSIISRGTMLIKYGIKTVKVSGELTFHPPVFYVDINSLKNWEEPFENEMLTDIEKKYIIEHLSLNSNKDDQTKIIFD